MCSMAISTTPTILKAIAMFISNILAYHSVNPREAR